MLFLCGGDFMQRMLWTQKLSDDKLKDILYKVDDLQNTGVTED